MTKRGDAQSRDSRKIKRIKPLLAVAALGTATAALAQMSVPAGLTLGSMSRVSPVLKAVRTHENFEPALAFPEQARAAALAPPWKT